jgi:hypothetical protein
MATPRHLEPLGLGLNEAGGLKVAADKVQEGGLQFPASFDAGNNRGIRLRPAAATAQAICRQGQDGKQ